MEEDSSLQPWDIALPVFTSLGIKEIWTTEITNQVAGAEVDVKRRESPRSRQKPNFRAIVGEEIGSPG